MSADHLARTLVEMAEKLKCGTLQMPRKVLCRNAYERRLVHQWAAQHGLTHATTLDYRCMHRNRRDEHGPTRVYSGPTLVYSKTPQSFVTVGGSGEPGVLGEPKAFSPEHRRVYSSGVYWSDREVFNGLVTQQ